MITLGLTGGVGMGKSTSAQFFAEQGVPVIDTDVLARQIVEPGQPALAEIVRDFGRDMVDAEGRLRRDMLARIVFADESRRRQLESILHPRIRDLWQAELIRWRDAGQRFGVVVIPLLFETQAESSFQRIVCTACSEPTQRQRLTARGWDEKQITQRRAAQWPIEKKIARSDFVVWTEGGLDVHAEQVARILRGMSVG